MSVLQSRTWLGPITGGSFLAFSIKINMSKNMKCNLLHVITTLIKIIYGINNIASNLKGLNQIDSI